MVAAAIGFGLSLPAAKLALRDLQPLQVLFWTRVVAALTLIPGIKRPRKALANAAIPGLLLGLILFAIFALQLAGLHKTTAVSGSFVSGMQVVATPFLAWLLIRERPTRTVVAGVAVACAGTALVVGAAPALAIGDLLVLAGALLLPFHTVVVSNWTRRVPARDLIRVQTLVAGLCAAAAMRGHLNPEAAADNALPILVGGVFGGSLAVTAQAYAQRRITAAQTGVILTLEPLVGSLVAFAWLGERPAGAIWLGGATIIAGIVLAARHDELPVMGSGTSGGGILARDSTRDEQCDREQPNWSPEQGLGPTTGETPTS
jgi:drug/metabolite transporter (DMT)-like permease